MQALDELPGRLSVSFCNDLGYGQLGRSIYAHKEKELSLSSPHRGEVDVEEADGVALELLTLGLVTCDVRQAAAEILLRLARSCCALPVST
jgi:hypothetical protein